MTRLFFAFLSALALALNPIASATAAAAPVTMADCQMKGEMPPEPADSQMDCCTPACQASAPALLAEREYDTDDLIARQVQVSAPVNTLYFFAPTGLDPPPRLLS